MRRERMKNPKCLGQDFPDTSSAKSAHLTGLKMRRITRAVSFDHLVGATKQWERYGQTERPCGLQVDDQFDLDCLLDRHLRRLFALENSARINSLLAVSVCKAWSIAHQPAGRSELPKMKDRRKRMAGRKYDKLLSSRIEECVGSDEECACSPPNQACEGGIDVAWTARLKDFNLSPECASRSLQVLQLLSCLWVVWIYDDRHNCDVWHQLM